MLFKVTQVFFDIDILSLDTLSLDRSPAKQSLALAHECQFKISALDSPVGSLSTYKVILYNCTKQKQGGTQAPRQMQ